MSLTRFQNDVFLYNVTTTDPIAFYCSVGSHCKSGMVGVINPAGDITVGAYKEKARGAGGAGAPGAVAGGQVISGGVKRSVAVGSLVAAVGLGILL